MEDYGKDRFWLSVYETLYFYGIVGFWKRFQEKTHLPFKIDEEKYNFRDESIVSAIVPSSYTRMLRLYGFFAVIIGILLPIVIDFIPMDHPFILDSRIGTLISILGLGMIFISSKKFRQFILGKDDNPQKLGK